MISVLYISWYQCCIFLDISAVFSVISVLYFSWYSAVFSVISMLYFPWYQCCIFHDTSGVFSMICALYALFVLPYLCCQILYVYLLLKVYSVQGCFLQGGLHDCLAVYIILDFLLFKLFWPLQHYSKTGSRVTSTPVSSFPPFCVVSFVLLGKA